MTDLNIIVGVQSGDAIRQLSNVQKGVDNVGVAAKKTTQQLKQHATQYNKTAVAANKLGKGVAQQAGYQFADFAVQIQNGTSAMQAFGQQGSQLLAIFGPAGAIAGAAVAIGSAFYTAFAGATTSASTFKDEIKDLNEELDVLRLGAGSAGEYALITQINEAAKALQEAKKELQEISAPTDLSSMSTAFTDPTAAGLEAAEGEVAAAQELVKERQKVLDELIREKNAKEILVKLTNSEVQEAQNLADNARRGARERKQENDERLANIKHMKEAHDALAASFRSGFAEEMRLRAARNRQFLNDKSSIETQLQLIKDEVNLRKMYTGEAYIQERLEQNKVRVLAEAKGLTGAQVDELVRLTTQLQTQKGDLEDILELERSRAFFAKEIADRQKEAHDALAASFGKGEDEKKSPVGRAKALAKVMKTELSPAAQRLVDLSNSIGSSFENAMMSSVRGTMSFKDAFRAMAADIISELYRVFFVKQATGFISDAIMGSMGYTPVKGGGYTMRPRARPMAAGGPVSAGSPYLVGERGPELIIPNQNGTVIPNNKLGGGAVVVNQTINVTTGVQQTVRAEVLGLLPQIQEASKAAVLDAKRRGGSFAGAF